MYRHRKTGEIYTIELVKGLYYKMRNPLDDNIIIVKVERLYKHFEQLS